MATTGVLGLVGYLLFAAGRSAWFGDLTLTHEADGTTTLRGNVTDQAQLFEVLAQVRDLGATLISLTPLDADSPPDAQLRRPAGAAFASNSGSRPPLSAPPPQTTWRQLGVSANARTSAVGSPVPQPPWTSTVPGSWTRPVSPSR